MKLLGNSPFGYRIMNRGRHTETKFLNNEKTRKAINGKLFKWLNKVLNELYLVELVKSEIEHQEPIIVGFSIFQCKKMRMLEFIAIFFDKFWDVDSFEELEMDTEEW